MITRNIKALLAYKNVTAAELAKKLGSTQANISQKFKRDNFRESELQEIANILNCDLEIKFIDRETKKIF